MRRFLTKGTWERSCLRTIVPPLAIAADDHLTGSLPDSLRVFAASKPWRLGYRFYSRYEARSMRRQGGHILARRRAAAAPVNRLRS